MRDDYQVAYHHVWPPPFHENECACGELDVFPGFMKEISEDIPRISEHS